MSKPDFTKLSREQKLQVLAALEEKKRRARTAKPPFVPTPSQLKVILSKVLERYLFCGNGFGKSTVLVNEVHWAATGYNPVTKESTPVPAKICLLLDSPEKIDDFLMEYRKWNELPPDNCSKKGKPNISFIQYDNGSTITVISHAVEPLKLEGSQWTHIFMDEPPPKQVFTALFRGGRIKGRPCKVLLAGTPITAAWLRTDVHEPWTKGELPDVECFTGETDENAANLDPGWFKRFFGKLSEKEAEIRRKGAFYDLDGLALSHLFREHAHIIPADDFEWDMNNPVVCVIDPHPSKKHVAILLGADRDNRLYLLKEIARKEVAKTFAATLREFMRGYRIVDVVCDSLGSADMTGGEGFKSFIDVLKREGIRVRATTFEEKEDEAWISRIQDVLLIPDEPDSFGQYIPKLRFLSNCPMGISDVKNVQWQRDKRADANKPTLDISNKDVLACIKYGLATNIYFDKAIKVRPHYQTGNVYGLGQRGVPLEAQAIQSNAGSAKITRLAKYVRRTRPRRDD